MNKFMMAVIVFVLMGLSGVIISPFVVESKIESQDRFTEEAALPQL